MTSARVLIGCRCQHGRLRDGKICGINWKKICDALYRILERITLIFFLQVTKCVVFKFCACEEASATSGLRDCVRERAGDADAVGIRRSSPPVSAVRCCSLLSATGSSLPSIVFAALPYPGTLVQLHQDAATSEWICEVV